MHLLDECPLSLAQRATVSIMLEILVTGSFLTVDVVVVTGIKDLARR